MYSNVQDTAIRNLQFCQALVTWDPRTGNPTKPAPQFKNRVRYSPRVKGTQPAITSSPITGQQYINTTTFPGLTQYCVTVPYLKPKGRQKVSWGHFSQSGREGGREAGSRSRSDKYGKQTHIKLSRPSLAIPFYPKNPQVDFLWYTDPCLLSARWIGWVNFQNPYNPSQTCEADVNREKPGQPLNRVNAIRTLDVSAACFVDGCCMPWWPE